jgi:hypothetical protein
MAAICTSRFPLTHESASEIKLSELPLNEPLAYLIAALPKKSNTHTDTRGEKQRERERHTHTHTHARAQRERERE